MLKNLGHRIRKLRKAKGLTLVEVSQKTGIAQATLSRIETCTMTGTVDSHEKIAEVLGVGLAELYTGVDRRYEQMAHLKNTAPRKVTQHSRHYQAELLTAESSKKKITPLQITIQPGAKTPSEKSERGVEKFVYVLDGEVTVHVEKEDYALQPEETLYFDASFSHHLSNKKQRKARVLVCVSPSKI